MAEAGPSKPPKRRKTQNACDYCKNHKLKCDFKADQKVDATICKHCSDFGIPCHVTPRLKVPRISNKASKPSNGSSSAVRHPGSPIWSRKNSVAIIEPRYAGATSLSQLVSAVTRKWPSRADQVLSRMDSRYGHQRVEGVSGGPFLMLPQVRYPPEQQYSKEMEEARISSSMKQELLAKYQRFVAPIFAILSNRESKDAIEIEVDNQPIATLTNLGLAILALAAMTRSTPKQTRMALLYQLRGRPQMDISSSLETIQYLLLLSANVELLSPDTNISTGMSLNLTGIVTRMAHDLGLHREISQLEIPKEHLNRRARIWAACIVQDRWFSLSYGQPCLIHLEDCDAPGPSPYHDEVAGSVASRTNDKPYEMHAEHTKLGILMGRLLRLVFTPRGMQNTSIEDMERLKYDLDRWTAELPDNLRFRKQALHKVPIGAGFLHLLKVAVDFIFYRAALVSTHNKSKSASMSPTLVWEDIVKRSAEAIEWISSTDGTSVLDAWSVAMYALIQCCLVQFYAAIGGEDPEPLRMARQCLHSWSLSIEAQSHGYYDPQEGDEPLPSSTTTAAVAANPNARGKKSLTLRTKINTLIAMLAGIAEHHIASQPAKNTSKNSTKHRKESSLSQNATKSTSNATQNRSTPSAYNFDAVLNPDHTQHPNPSAQSGNQGVPIHSSDIYRLTNGHQTPEAPMPSSYVSSSTHRMSDGAISTDANYSQFSTTDYDYSSDLQQIDFLTLQRWADEVMRNPPAFDIRHVPTMNSTAGPPPHHYQSSIPTYHQQHQYPHQHQHQYSHQHQHQYQQHPQSY